MKRILTVFLLVLFALALALVPVEAEAFFNIFRSSCTSVEGDCRPRVNERGKLGYWPSYLRLFSPPEETEEEREARKNEEKKNDNKGRK